MVESPNRVRLSLASRPLEGATPATARELFNKLSLYRVIFSRYFQLANLHVNFTLSVIEHDPYQLKLAVNSHSGTADEVAQAIADAAEFAKLQVDTQSRGGKFIGFRKRPNSGVQME